MKNEKPHARRLHRGRALRAALVILAFAGRIASAADRIEPNPIIQSQINEAAAAQTEAELQTALVKLKASGGMNYEILIPQLVAALMQTRDDRQAMIPGVIIDRLGITKEQLHHALDAYRGTDDPRLKAQLDNLLNE